MKLTKIKQNGKYGLADAQGQMLAPCIYDFIFPFVEGFAVVSIGPHLNGEQGVINEKGKEIIPVRNRGIHFYSEGYFLVQKQYGTYCFFNAEGKQVGKDIELSGFNPITSLKEGLARVEFGHQKYGFVDCTGTQVIAKTYYAAGLFCDGLARVQADGNGLWGFIDKKGQEKVPYIYQYVQDFKEGFAPVSIHTEDGRNNWTYINTKGEQIVPPQYTYASYFHKGRAVVSKFKGNYTYTCHLIDTQGNILADLGNYAYMDKTTFEITTERYGKRGVISTHNEVLLPFEYEEINHDFCGFRRVKKDGLEGVINSKNQMIVPCKYDKVHVSSASGIHHESVRVSCYGDEYYFNQNSFHRTTVGVEKGGKFGGFPVITNNDMVYYQDFIPVSYARKAIVDKIGEYYILNSCTFPILDILSKLQSTDKNEATFGKDLLKTVNYLMETGQVQDIAIDTTIVLPIAINWATSTQMNERIMSAHLIKALYLNIKKNKTPLIPLEYKVYKAFEVATAKNPLPLNNAFEIIVPDYGFTNLFYPFTTNGENYRAFVDTDWSVKFLDDDNTILTKVPKGTDKALEKTFKEISKTYTGLQFTVNQQFTQHQAEGKTWTGKEWKSLFLSNPFYFNVALTCKWQTQSGLIFTLLEDQSLEDINTDEIELGDAEIVFLR